MLHWFKHFSRLTAPLLAAVLLVGACSGGMGSPKGSIDHLRVGLVSSKDFSNVDPAKGKALEVNSYVQEFLMKLSPTGEVKPNLAKSVKQEDDVTYVYTLRNDVNFSNGDPLTAGDVVASLDYMRNPKFAESWRYTAIKDVSARDDRTVVVTLNKPTASWKYVLAMNGYIFNAKHRSEHKDDFGQPGVGVIGTGPYTISKLDPTSGVAELTANENYWGGDVPFQKVTLRVFADETSEAIAFRTGEIDLAFPVDVRGFEATADTKVTSVPGTRQGLFIMNVGVAPWDDVHVRRAVAYALNREEIVNVAGGNAEPDYAIIPPAQLRTLASEDEVDALLQSLPRYEFDLEKAKQELSLSAHPDGFRATLSVANLGNFVATAEAIAGQLEKIGIDLEVKVLSGAEASAIYSEPHAEHPVQYTYFNNNSPDPGAMPRLALDSAATVVGQNNFADYKNPKVDALIAAADATNDPSERLALYAKMLQIVARDVP